MNFFGMGWFEYTGHSFVYLDGVAKYNLPANTK